MSLRVHIASRRRLPTACAGALLCATLALTSSAAELRVGAGSALDLGTATVALGCASLTVSGSLGLNGALVHTVDDVVIAPGGTLDGGAGVLSFTGDWHDDGVFAAGTSVVILNDGCGNTTSTVTGSSTFHELSLLSGTGKTVLFEAGQRTTVTGGLTLAGAPADLLVLRSTTPGVAAELYVEPSTPQSIAYVDVDDSHATGYPLVYGPDSVAGSNAIAWLLDVAPVPVAGAVGATALAVTLGALGARRLARRRSG